MVEFDKKTRNSKKMAGKLPVLSPSSAKAEPQIQDLIGRRLKAYYDDVVNEPVPDRFVELLNRLEAKSSTKSEG